MLPIYAMPMTLLSSSSQERKREKYIYIYILQLALAQEIPAEANGRRDCSAVGQTVMQHPIWSHELPALVQVALPRK